MMKFQENIPLKKYTTFKIGGSAKYFFVAKTKTSLVKAIQAAKKASLPFFILGGGSNLLISDEGYQGLIIKTGKPLSSYVSKGLEWAAGIPGTVEGAVWGNAGAFGKSMQDVVKKVEVFDIKDGKIKILNNKDCQFGYRDSIFKKNKNLIILSVKIKTRKSNLNKIKEYLNYRKDRQPLNLPSAGSVFKNPKNYSAGELIEKAGLRGKKIGGAQISNIHANFIVNLNKATAQDVLSLIKLIKKTVYGKFKVKLREEIVILY
ncbi:MAG: UDP-N-acetylenolpyruvoylglucosamine reductase [Candidatus Nealsonbacteria bacterium RIFCSPHIGHO2_01_FULL_43_31]|uniref:UDP-N-acetylenolpyruvoylglucosamine reductase n=1 Tax=Candidatus Nealsonbacteria bacterium RIFCSPHIGHO2_01_FULL_43_31 TaxID=1801665 RepID=A0A1G2E4P9_9BACT|nr:MAG: UDP-N-acetylenolpyruvoylglucosamine reductase [Candidatus Nealsonbacteria bacterium RIFCSPHIGHO2_01_FULL_43_31]OGZ25002.1 MAG: UDP-N-acetylenolpyruvoylglucosamine reductase [Candidatus Nealsonbacteria bacterium RIFCSPLOWO2_01_FULL_43_36]